MFNRIAALVTRRGWLVFVAWLALADFLDETGALSHRLALLRPAGRGRRQPRLPRRVRLALSGLERGAGLQPAVLLLVKLTGNNPRR